MWSTEKIHDFYVRRGARKTLNESTRDFCWRAPDGEHRNTVVGEPLSGDTIYACTLCGYRRFRG